MSLNEKHSCSSHGQIRLFYNGRPTYLRISVYLVNSFFLLSYNKLDKRVCIAIYSGFGLFSDNVAKESKSRWQTKNENKIHLMTFLGAHQYRIDDDTLSDRPTTNAKVYGL